MKNFYLFVCFLSVGLVLACKSEKKSDAVFETSNQFSGLIKDLNTKFTEKAGYSCIILSYDKLMGNTIMVKVAKDLNSDTIEEWYLMNGKWDKKSDILLELENVKPSDILFTINGDFDLAKLVEMVDVSKDKAESEKKAKDVECKNVNLLMKNKGTTANKMDGLIIQITVGNADGSNSFDLGFDAKGDFEGFLD